MKPSSPKSLTVPQSYFLHFYLMAAAITTCLLACVWLYAYNEMSPLSAEPLGLSAVASHLAGGGGGFRFFSGYRRKGIASVRHRLSVWRTVFMLLLMEAQVLRRLYETRAVFDYSPSARMHVHGYLIGLFFYTAVPLSLARVCAPVALSYTGGQIAEFIVKGRETTPAI